MPDDRMIHRAAGHGRKVNSLTSDEFRVWLQYELSADDFGVMLFSARPLQADNNYLYSKPAKTVMRWLQRVLEVGLLLTFDHQEQTYCCQWDWQRWQKVEYPRPTVHPKPSDAALGKCDEATRLLFTVHSGGRRAPSPKILKTSQNVSEDLPKDLQPFDHLARAGARMAQAKAQAKAPAPAPIFPPRRGDGLMAGSKPIEHGECLAHGPVCMRPPIVKKYLGRFNGDTVALKAWGEKVCERWAAKVDRGEPVPYGDDFAFWTAAYDEDFGASRTNGAKADGPRVPDADETSTYLAKLRGGRAS